MVNVILSLSLLLSVVCVTHGQSTAGDNAGCVYSFKVPMSDCAQTPGPSVDDQILRNTVLALQEQVKQLVSEVRNLKKEGAASATGKASQQSSTGGAVYTRWGRKMCPGNGTDLLYWGVVAGSHFSHSGGGSNYLCLPRNPEWGKTTAGFQSGESLYGAEYEVYPTNDPFPKVNGRLLYQNDVPCAVCLMTSRPANLMIPARLTCPDGWTKEYSGYLMAQHRTQTRTTYVCVDSDPEVIEGGAADQNGVLFYNVEAVCGSLPCPNYVNGWEITCVVCTK